jgi:dolichol-phosphate mannosyltransferase
MQTSSNYIVTLDGDGQNDPRDILKLLKNFETDKEFMMVIGNRVKRIDNFARRLASRSAFKIRKFILKDETPDTGCAIKVFKKEDFLKLPFFNHIHRFLPFLFNSFKGKVISIQVNHRARINGYSKYSNFQRFLVGISDIFGVIWLRKRSKWPINYEKVNNIKLIKRGKNGN